MDGRSSQYRVAEMAFSLYNRLVIKVLFWEEKQLPSRLSLRDHIPLELPLALECWTTDGLCAMF